jgi:tripartite-type tricarboxylate transporter receptor subunit TctC
VLAPAHTPAAVIARLHENIVKILAVSETRARLADQGFEPVGNSPEEFGAYIKSEIAKWGKVIGDAGIRPE